jgi:hypothetical protein
MGVNVGDLDSSKNEDIPWAVGMSSQNWYRIEQEKQSITVEQLRKIEEVLKTDFGVKFE